MSKYRVNLWIYVLTSLIAIISLFAGISLYLTPSTFLKEIDFSISGTIFLTQMWAARQIALSLTIFYAIFSKSNQMLKATMIIYALMNLQDAIIGMFRKDLSLSIGAIFFMLLSSILVHLLSKSDTKPNFK